MSRSSTRILFASSHCLTDVSSGAAIATADALRLLTRANFRCRAFCASKFDAPVEERVDDLLADLHIPVQHQEMAVGDCSVPLISLCLGDLPVTIFETQSARIDAWLPGEPEAMLAAFERVVDDFRPEVLLTYGGDLVTRAMMQF